MHTRSKQLITEQKFLNFDIKVHKPKSRRNYGPLGQPVQGKLKKTVLYSVFHMNGGLFDFCFLWLTSQPSGGLLISSRSSRQCVQTPRHRSMSSRNTPMQVRTCSLCSSVNLFFVGGKCVGQYSELIYKIDEYLILCEHKEKFDFTVNQLSTMLHLTPLCDMFLCFFTLFPPTLLPSNPQYSWLVEASGTNSV